MKTIMLVAIFAASVTSAQQVTYHYTGQVMTLMGQAGSESGGTQTYTDPYAFVGDVVLSQALNPNQANQQVIPLAYTINDPGTAPSYIGGMYYNANIPYGSPLEPEGPNQLPWPGAGPPGQGGIDGVPTLTFSTVNGNITSFSMTFGGWISYGGETLTISSAGDSYSSSIAIPDCGCGGYWNGSNSVGGTWALVPANSQTYAGIEVLLGTGAAPLGVNASGQVTGFAPGTAASTQAFVTGADGVGATYLGESTVFSEGVAVNTSGQVAVVTNIGGLWQGYLTGPNALGMTALQTLANGNETYPYALNDSGNVTGFSGTQPNVKAFITGPNGTGIRSLGTLGRGTVSVGYAVNSSGQVAGYSTLNGESNERAFITGPIGSGMSPIATFGDPSLGLGINTSGQVTGYFELPPNNSLAHAFMTGPNGENATDLGTLPGDDSSFGLAINDYGQVVGYSLSSTGNGVGTAFLYENGQMLNLNSLIDPNSGIAPYVTLIQGVGITNTGNIVAWGTDNRYPDETITVLLTVEGNVAPSVSPVVYGTLGQNGWYVTTATLSWAVTGVPAPTTSGCGTASVPNTKGTTYTCTATNASGSANQSASIKEDTVAPQVTIKSPRKGEVYALNASVRASYTCLDATSGIATCSGTLPDGAKIPTATAGTYTFAVTSTDNAGNQTSKSILYSVN